MKKFFWILLVTLGVIGNTSAYGAGQASTYTNVLWTLTTAISGFSSCTELRLDATGDLQNSNMMVAYGGLNCQEGTYGVTGSAYIANNGNLVMNLIVGLGNSVFCNNLVALSGDCLMYDPTGAYLGGISLKIK